MPVRLHPCCERSQKKLITRCTELHGRIEHMKSKVGDLSAENRRLKKAMKELLEK